MPGAKTRIPIRDIGGTSWPPGRTCAVMIAVPRSKAAHAFFADFGL
jgi:hypothetical protein